MDLPKRAGDKPVEVDLEKGKTYAWCACGLSKNQPFCDGSHKGSGITPTSFTAEKTGTAHLCGCKHSKNSPYCDGSHHSL